MRLSLCIPTYNRANTLPKLLDSIAAQTGYDLDLEIVISDNGSTDGTRNLVGRYKAAGLNIVYHRMADNQGFDRNILNAVTMASGEFCWFYGSDDFLEPGALASIEQTLRRHPGTTGISIGLQAYAPDLSRKIHLDDHVSTDFPAETLLLGRGPIIAAVGACFGFMSSIVVRRAVWLRAVEKCDLEPYMLGYIHTFVIARMLDDQSEWVVVPTRLVGYRGSEGVLSSANEFARTKLDIVGFDLAIGDTLGRDHWAYRRAMSMVAKYGISVHFLNAKLQGASSAYWREAIPTTVAYYWRYPGFWLRTFPLALIPRGVLLGTRTFYRKTLKRARERRLTKG